MLPLVLGRLLSGKRPFFVGCGCVCARCVCLRLRYLRWGLVSKKPRASLGLVIYPPRKRFFGPGGGAVGRVRKRRRIRSARSRAITCTYNEHVSLYLQQTPASCNYTNCNYMYRGCVCQGYQGYQGCLGCQGWHSLADCMIFI